MVLIYYWGMIWRHMFFYHITSITYSFMLLCSEMNEIFVKCEYKMSDYMLISYLTLLWFKHVCCVCQLNISNQCLLIFGILFVWTKKVTLVAIISWLHVTKVLLYSYILVISLFLNTEFPHLERSAKLWFLFDVLFHSAHYISMGICAIKFCVDLVDDFGLINISLFLHVSI